MAEVKNKTKKRKHIILVIFLIVIISVIVAVCGVFVVRLSEPKNLTVLLADQFQIEINNTKVIYNEVLQSDTVCINMNVKNIKQNSLYESYNSEVPTADQVTPEQESQLTQEEINKININTINKHLGENLNKIDLSKTINVFASQDGEQLDDVECLRDDGTNNNKEGFNVTLDVGESKDIILYYKLVAKEDCKLLFSASYPIDPYTGKVEHNPKIDFQELDLPIYELTSSYERQSQELNNKIISEKENAEIVNFAKIRFYLVDGWYAETQAQSVIIFKNRKFTDASLQVSFSKSENASQLAQSMASGAIPPLEVINKSFDNITAYLLNDSNKTFTLFLDGTRGYAYSIKCKNVSLDDVTHFISSIEFV